MFPLILLLFTAPDSAKLTLVPNTKEILQGDNLLVLDLLENRSISAVRLSGDIDSMAGWIRHEIQNKHGRWIKITPAIEQIAILCGIRGECLLQGKSTYAECEGIHRRSQSGPFLFETPGTYKIRSVATMPWGELPSEPITITVRQRDEADLKKIESLRPADLLALALHGLDRPLPEKLLELKPVGGNIAWTIDQWEKAQAVSEGGQWRGIRISKEKNCEWLRESMDPVAYEHSLERLGSYYRSTKQWEPLSRVVPAMKYDSMKRRGFIYQLELLTRPPKPAKP